MENNFESRFTDNDEMVLKDLRRMERLPDAAEAKRLAEYLMRSQQRDLIKWDDGSRHSENWEHVVVEMLINLLERIINLVVTEVHADREPVLEIYYENARNGTEFEYVVNRRLGHFSMTDEKGIPSLQITIQATELPKRDVHIIVNRFAVTGRRMKIESTEYPERLPFEEILLFAYFFNKYADQQKLYNRPLSDIFSKFIKEI